MECTSEVRDIKIVMQEGKSKICFHNPKRRKIKRTIVDDCLLKEGKRCDYMLEDHNAIEYYIELKGKEIAHACLQIEETIKQLSASAVKAPKLSFVVSSKCPLTDTKIQGLKFRFKSRYNCELIIKNNVCEHHIA